MPPDHLPNDWRPSAELAMIQARADLFARLRAFFAAAGVLEVETPILSQAAVTDPALASLSVGGVGPARSLYLQTSPEFPMKRLLAAGSGPIYQICKVFRDDERGRLHHPEFSLLEWYRPGWDPWRLMDEVAELTRVALQRPTLPVERIAYRELFLQRLHLDPWSATVEDLRGAALAAGIADAASLDLDADAWLDLLLTHCLEAGLGRDGMTFLVDYPPSQAALARIRPGPIPVAERFELYLEGVELANGFQELTDAVEQRARFQADLAQRRRRGQSEPPLDERLLAALAAGMPECSGVALGLDRLLMMATGVDRIDGVLAFPVERA
ncbi:EF-P lysine aminoacylase GenX [Thiocystis minor]|uniref:EF-P lysine aminoacylase EpmA n=1 Tax=Thiocystis minor TaxID=61597 RepID=UPI001912BD47|nr:EF-P lysine aminoacylase EpmA [Thiocystis minor]MBK5965007.1 EF-P lysine aminoacylase GenX [Thiocystis minor]